MVHSRQLRRSPMFLRGGPGHGGDNHHQRDGDRSYPQPPHHTHGYLDSSLALAVANAVAAPARSLANADKLTASGEALWKPQSPGSDPSHPQNEAERHALPAETRKRSAAARPRPLMVRKGSPVRVRSWAWVPETTNPRTAESDRAKDELNTSRTTIVELCSIGSRGRAVTLSLTYRASHQAQPGADPPCRGES